MNKYKSQIIESGSVTFPEFRAEKVYMESFYINDGLPKHLARWQETVNQMLRGVETNQPVYIMIDQAFVPAGQSHRRPGLHIDGYWVPEENSHGTGHKSTSSLKGSHTGHKAKSSLKGTHTGHKASKNGHSPSWETSSFHDDEAIILASNISSARAFEGEFIGIIKDMGRCDHISTDGLKEISLEANKVYIGNVTFLHETLPVEQDSFRTLVRLNVPGFKI